MYPPLRHVVLVTLPLILLLLATPTTPRQIPLIAPSTSSSKPNDNTHEIPLSLFADLEELSRLVDISYCVGLTGTGIGSPFSCLSWCPLFPTFELVTAWNTGPLLADSCGYIAVAHPDRNSSNPAAHQGRIIVAFRGTYSIANTIVDLATMQQEYVGYDPPLGDGNNGTDSRHKCTGCAVHSGFHGSWLLARETVLPAVKELWGKYGRSAGGAGDSYRLALVGHSLGGAVAALAALEFDALGMTPSVTTFGEPRVGNSALADYFNGHFVNATARNGLRSAYRRVTHVKDPVPLLPPSSPGLGFNYSSHANELFITKSDLPPDRKDFIVCEGNGDERCSYGENSGWKVWEIFTSHRDYFHRLGLCVPKSEVTKGGPSWWGKWAR